jgi:hypothetical protein
VKNDNNNSNNAVAAADDDKDNNKGEKCKSNNKTWGKESISFNIRKIFLCCG